MADQVMACAKNRKIQISQVQALKLAQGAEVTALDTTYRANRITGELVITGANMNWRRTLARHKAEVLIKRWRESIASVESKR